MGRRWTAAVGVVVALTTATTTTPAGADPVTVGVEIDPDGGTVTVRFSGAGQSGEVTLPPPVNPPSLTITPLEQLAEPGEWARQIGTPGVDAAWAAAGLPMGGTYVAGRTEGELGPSFRGQRDAFVRRFDPAGREVWTRQFGSGVDDEALGVAADPVTGDAYVVGYTSGQFAALPAGARDAFVAKFRAADGVLLWAQQFGTSASDQLNGVAADATSVYVTGSTSGSLAGASAGSADAFVRRLTSAGVEEWSRQFGTAQADGGFGASTVPGGGVVVSGSTWGTLPGEASAGGEDAFVRRYDAAGTAVMTDQFGSSQRDLAHAAATDGSGAFYVAGMWSSEGSAETPWLWADAFVRRYEDDGFKWSVVMATAGHDSVFAATTDPAGNVYLAGMWGDTAPTLPIHPAGGPLDSFFHARARSGAPLAFERVGSSSGANDLAYGIALDGRGRLFGGGFTNGSFEPPGDPGNTDAFAVRVFLDSDGDCVPDGEEGVTYGSGATSADSDGDRLPDDAEAAVADIGAQRVPPAHRLVCRVTTPAEDGAETVWREVQRRT